MAEAEQLVDVWRGDFAESSHAGHWVIAEPGGRIIEGGGDASRIILPRSSLKPLQVLPLIESGAADAAGLGPEQIALACASHQGAPIHTDRVQSWLQRIDRVEGDLRCGVQPPATADDRQALRDASARADQTHNNCSGKHTGFLTLARHLDAGPEYLEPDHPVQLAVRDAVEGMTDEQTFGFATDGCTAPNFGVRLSGLARAMARIAVAGPDDPSVRQRAAFTARTAMAAHPELVAGEGRACTRLMRAMGSSGVVKTGAEGVYVAALPGLGLGVALKISDGAGRASEVAMTSILVRLGVLEANDPEVQDLLRPRIRNWRGIVTGHLAPA